MHSLEDWKDDVSPMPATAPLRISAAGQLPPAIEAAVWRGNEIGTPVTSTLRTGWDVPSTVKAVVDYSGNVVSLKEAR